MKLLLGISFIFKKVFIREIVSNSSDALEKLRHLQVLGNDIVDPDLPLEIHLTTDEEKGLFIIQDFGIGMKKEELVNNLGTIARSGSKAFIEQVKESESVAAHNIIGQFGVGFYSTFMVGSKIDVYTRSCEPNSQGYYWTSDGLVLMKFHFRSFLQCSVSILLKVFLLDQMVGNISISVDFLTFIFSINSLDFLVLYYFLF